MIDFLMDRLVGPVGFAMERRTLLGIAERANGAAGLSTPPAWREPLWFAALLATGAGLVGLLATPTPPARKAVFATLITAAATLVLLRFPSAVAAVLPAVVTVGMAARLHHVGGAGVLVGDSSKKRGAGSRGHRRPSCMPRR